MLMFTYLIGQSSSTSNYIPKSTFLMTNPFLRANSLVGARMVNMEGHTLIWLVTNVLRFFCVFSSHSFEV